MSVIERILRRDAGGVNITIAPMRRRDVKRGVMEIEATAYPRPWSRRVFESELDQVRSGSRYYVAARVGRELVGYAGLWFTADEAHVTNIAVRADLRRSGVGSRLLVALADEAIRRDAVAWTLEVRVSSTGAQELYRRFGFVPAGVRKQYYEGHEDAIVMWCHDLATPEYRNRLDSIRAEAEGSADG